MLVVCLLASCDLWVALILRLGGFAFFVAGPVFFGFCFVFFVVDLFFVFFLSFRFFSVFFPFSPLFLLFYVYICFFSLGLIFGMVIRACVGAAVSLSNDNTSERSDGRTWQRSEEQKRQERRWRKK